MMHDLHFTRRSLALAALVIGLVTLLTAAFWNYTQDDVFITYTYSRNIATGHGFVFNPGERVQGTTTPLYTLFVAGVYLFSHDLLHAGNLLSALALLAVIGLAVSLTRSALSWAGRAALAITLAVSPLAYVSFGMETLFYTTLLLLAFWCWARSRPIFALLAAAALTWTRADGIVLAGALGLAAVWGGALVSLENKNNSTQSTQRLLEGKSIFPWKLALAYLIGIAPWFLFAWLYFGTMLPQTFSAKQELFQGTVFLKDGDLWRRSFYGNNPLIWIGVPLVLLGLWQAVIRPALRPLALWAVFYLAGYTALNVSAFWYYTPLLVVLIVLAALGGDWLARVLARRTDRRIVTGPAWALILISAGLAVLRAWDYRLPPPRMATYRLAGEWINRHVEPGATLMVKDLGIVGYYAHRHTLDTFGLIVPDMYEPHDNYAVAKYRPDYLIATQYWEMKRLVAQDWFQADYLPLAQFSTPGDGEFSPMTLYRRRMPTTTPPQVFQGFDLPLTCTVTRHKGDPLPGEISARIAADPSGDPAQIDQSHPFLWGQYPAQTALGKEKLIDQIALPLELAPGSYTWSLDCGGSTSSAAVSVLPVEQAPNYRAFSAEWSPFAQLKGIALPDGLTTWAGGSLAVVLHWEALGPADQDYSVFVHLLDSSGQLAAQSDGSPRNNTRPTFTWQAQETIVDVRYLRLPPTLPPGTYTLEIGWYDWRTDTRLTLTGGDHAGQDALPLPFSVSNRWPGGSGKP